MKPKVAKTKKLDIFNLFYSGAAVVILIGVIAKLLEWPAQDLLITGGLAIEAVVFGVSAIKFVDVEVKQEVATEATLSKVAEGLGTIASNAKAAAGETYINIQTGDGTFSSESMVGGTTAEIANIKGTQDVPNTLVRINNNTVINDAVPIAKDNNFKIEINGNNINGDNINADLVQKNTAHSLWQLEQMDILSLAKDLFFQPAWDKLNTDDYTQISQIFKRIFDKKMPNKEALPFLIQFPVKLPIPEMSKLVLEKAHAMQAGEVELLCKAFSIIKFNTFFDNFILTGQGEVIEIRPRKAKEQQVFGGEEELVLSHLQSYFTKELIISPNIECLNSLVRLKGQTLIEYLIQKIDIKQEAELFSLTNILTSQSDELKKKLLSKFKKVRYNVETAAGYAYLKNLVQTTMSFTDSSLGQQYFNKIIEFQITEKKTIILDDVVNCYSDTIYFGPKNEYSVALNELFVNGELTYLNYINSIIEKLVADNVTTKSKLLELFNMKEQDSKKDVFTKLNYHLAKTNTVPAGSQLAFILLYKQYS